MERNSCIFYKSFYDSIKELDPKDQVQIYNAIFKYQFDNELVDLKGVCKSIFTLIIPQLEANNKRYENGTKGGRPKTKIKPNENQKETRIKPNENVNVNDNENNNDNINNNVQNEFEELWKIYPKKVGKKKSFDYYKKARQKTSYETIKQGIENYVNYINSSKTPMQYVKDGSTWFNQECWNDVRDYKIAHKETQQEITERLRKWAEEQDRLEKDND